MYLLIGGIKLMCTLSFTFEGNYETNLKTLLECMNRQFFFSHFTPKLKKKSKVPKSHIFCSWCMVQMIFSKLIFSRLQQSIPLLFLSHLSSKLIAYTIKLCQTTHTIRVRYASPIGSRQMIVRDQGQEWQRDGFETGCPDPNPTPFIKNNSHPRPV